MKIKSSTIIPSLLCWWHLIHQFDETNAFAGGGFGGASTNQAKSKKPNKSKKSPKRSNAPNKSLNLLTPEGRMDHIQSRIAQADFSSIAKLSLQQQQQQEGQLVLDIDPRAVCVVEDFLGEDLLQAMRAEAEALFPTMIPSQSTRWDEVTQSVVPYEKVGVYSTQIEGGTAGYQASPRLVEYVVTLTTHLGHKLNSILPETHQLSTQEQTNKLAVCLGDGSKYDKHIDNLGGDDRRKLTALLYLQPPDSHTANYPHESIDERGGYFRAYDVPERDQVTNIAPRGNRLLLFWSDSLVHDVSPSFCPRGDADRRWALTTWFVASETGSIRSTDAKTENAHFGTG